MATRLAILALLAITYGTAGPSVHAAQQKNMDLRSDSTSFGQDVLLKDQPDFRFSGANYDKLSPAIRSQAENYLAFYLTPEAQPQKDPQFAVRTFAATEQTQNDLVEYRWTFAGVPLRAVQSWNAMKVDIPLSGHASIEEAKALLASIVKLKGVDVEGNAYEVHPHWPDTLADGVKFSSNPNADIRSLPSWHERVDAFVEGNHLNILIYKKIPQLMGYQDGSKWFQKYPPAKTSQK
jgi:hypothetical protein